MYFSRSYLFKMFSTTSNINDMVCFNSIIYYFCRVTAYFGGKFYEDKKA